MTTEEDLQRTTKFIASLGQVKTEWQIVRKLISYSSKMLFIHKFLKNNKISFIFQNKGIVFKALVCGIVGQLYVLNIVQKWIFGYCIQKSI